MVRVKRKKREVGSVRFPQMHLTVVDIDSVANLKEWTIVGNLLVLVGGGMAAGGFLFFQPGIDRLTPISFLLVGGVMIALGIYIEWQKFSHFANRMKKGRVEDFVYLRRSTSSSRKPKRHLKEASKPEHFVFVQNSERVLRKMEEKARNNRNWNLTKKTQ
jgi:hypothetical protein